MVLLVASDTHGHADRLLTAVSRVRPAALLFLGDGLSDLSVLPSELPVRAVCGNCDFFGREFPTCRLEVFGQTRIFLTHGHTLGVKGGLNTRSRRPFRKMPTFFYTDTRISLLKKICSPARKFSVTVAWKNSPDRS